jgi:hypothetical protein
VDCAWPSHRPGEGGSLVVGPCARRIWIPERRERMAVDYGLTIPRITTPRHTIVHKKWRPAQSVDLILWMRSVTCS